MNKSRWIAIVHSSIIQHSCNIIPQLLKLSLKGCVARQLCEAPLAVTSYLDRLLALSSTSLLHYTSANPFTAGSSAVMMEFELLCVKNWLIRRTILFQYATLNMHNYTEPFNAARQLRKLFMTTVLLFFLWLKTVIVWRLSVFTNMCFETHVWNVTISCNCILPENELYRSNLNSRVSFPFASRLLFCKYKRSFSI